MLMSNFMNERKIICLADALGINIKIAIRKQREGERISENGEREMKISG